MIIINNQIMTNIEQLKKKTDEIKKWLEELKNNVDKVKEFSKGKFMAFAATIEGEVGEIPEDFLKWLLDSDFQYLYWTYFD